MSKTRSTERKRRHQSIRKKIVGTPDRPRLSVFRSHQHVYAQIIDDEAGHTLTACSSLEKELRQTGVLLGNKDAARKVGERLAEKAKEKGITRIVFDRGGNLYHGRVAALADGAREKGLEF